MDKQTKEIIKQIANIQLEALSSIIEHPEDKEHELLIKYFQVKPEEIVSTAEDIYRYYQEIKETPELLALTNEYQLLVCHHILFTMEDIWILENNQGVYGAWEFLHQALDKFHPEFKLILYKHDKS